MLTPSQLGQEEPTAATVHSVGCGMFFQTPVREPLDANDYQLTKGTIIEVNDSELGLVTRSPEMPINSLPITVDKPPKPLVPPYGFLYCLALIFLICHGPHGKACSHA